LADAPRLVRRGRPRCTAPDRRARSRRTRIAGHL